MATLTCPMLVGRRRELDEADALLDALLGGAGTVAVVSEEPGVGKSRLAGAIAGSAAGRGARVLPAM